MPIAAVVSSLLASILSAQTQSPTPDAPKASSDGEVVKLSTFNVSTDRDSGYRASNSIAATRTDTPIKDVPLNIQVFTKDLYDDLFITNQVDLERYNASLVNGSADAHSDNPIQQSFNAFLFRGFVQNWGLRDGVRQYDPIDTQSLARVEVVKGPAAALYGLAYPGGVMNSITKTVDFTKNFTQLRATAQNYGEYRGTVDANYSGNVAGGKFGVRYNGAWADTSDEREHSDGSIRSSQLNLEWAPLPNTLLRWVGETGYREKPNGLGYFTRPEAADPTGGNNAQVPLQVVHPEIPWDWNWSNGRNMRSLETTFYKGSVEQKVGDNFSVTAYLQNQSHTQIDGNGWDANGSGGADSWEAGGGWITDPVTKAETIQSGYSYRDWSNSIHAYGATAVYKLDLDQVKNTFTFGSNVWSEKFISRVSNQSNSTNKQLIIYPVKSGIPIPITFGPPPDLMPITGYYDRASNTVSALDPSGNKVTNAYSHEDNSNDYYFASWQGSLFEDRWKLNASINHTNLKLVQWSSALDQSPNVTKVSKNSPLIGTVFDITKEYSVFLVHSTSLFPSTDKNSFGTQMPSVIGSSYEGGLKLDALNGRLSGTLSTYRITQTGGGKQVGNVENRDTGRWDKMTDAERAINFANKTRADLFKSGDVVAAGKQRSTGIEADLVFQATPSWQVLVTYANNDVKSISSPLASDIGRSTVGHIRQQFAMLHKYTFTEGELKGLYLGLGYQHAGKALQDYLGANGTPRFNPSTNFLEAFAGYHLKLLGYNTMVQFNAKNLTKQDDFVGWKATGSPTVIATERYKVPVPIRYSLTFGVDL